jgi:gas vesicle structural protein
MAITAPAPRAQQTPGSRGSVQKMGGSSGIADVLVVILDKGLVVDAWVRLSIIGIEILTVEIRAVIASVDTYLRYAEAIGLTTLAAAPRSVEPMSIPNFLPGGGGHPNGNGAPSFQGMMGPSDDDILSYLEAHPDGVRLSELQAYFGVERQTIESILNRLVQDAAAALDPQRGLWRSGKLLAPITA